MPVPAQSIRLKLDSNSPLKPAGLLAILPAKGSPERRRFVLGAGLVLAFGLPLLFSAYIWFGGAPDAQELSMQLGEPVRVTQARQALAQISVRMSRGDSTMQRWYPRMRELAAHPDAELRQSVASAMGRDRSEASFQDPLRKLMLTDSDVMVRRAAAISLAARGDAEAKPVLASMLQPHAVRSPVAGTVRVLVHPGDRVSPWTEIARQDKLSIRAEVPGVVKGIAAEGNLQTEIGRTLVEIAPDSEQTALAQQGLQRLATRR